MTAYDDVRVVILGQDPYPGADQANGLCFAVHEGVAIPKSMRNIFREILSDTGVRPEGTELTGWAEQGVLLLNSILTVRSGSPASHHRMGWERFTDEVIRFLDERSDPMVFLLWGNYAREKGKHIRNHPILEAPHPSPLSAHRGFFGCKHFSRVNEHLRQMYNVENMINWSKTNVQEV